MGGYGWVRIYRGNPGGWKAVWTHIRALWYSLFLLGRGLGLSLWWWWLVVTLVWWWLQITGSMRQRARLTTTTTAITSNIIGIVIIIHYPFLLLTIIIRRYRKTTSSNSSKTSRPPPHPPRAPLRPSINGTRRTTGSKRWYAIIINSTVTGVPFVVGRCRISVRWGLTWSIIIRETRPHVPLPLARKHSLTLTAWGTTCVWSIRCNGIR